MTVATNTILGEIKLAGDLAGNNNGNAPELIPSGVTAGTYHSPGIVVDSKGRITLTLPAAGLSIPMASKTVTGIAQIGDNINVTSVTSGRADINFNYTISGGSSTGLSNSTARFNFTVTFNSINSVTVNLAGNSIQTITALVNAVNSAISPYGVMSFTAQKLMITSNMTGASSLVVISPNTGDTSIETLFVNMTGYVSTTYTGGGGSAVISVPLASSSVYGVARVDGTSITSVNGVLSANPANFPKASTSTFGVVAIQSGGGINVSKF